MAVGEHYGFRPRSLPEPLLHLGAYPFGAPRRPGGDPNPGTSRLPAAVGGHHAQGEPCHAMCHFYACPGPPEGRLARGAFETHADAVYFAAEPRHVLWEGSLVG